MKNIVNKIRRTAQIGLLVGTLLSGCINNNALPVSQSTYEAEKQRIELNTQRAQELERDLEIKNEQAFEKELSDLTKYKEKIKSDFNNYISDGIFSVKEQRNIQENILKYDCLRDNLSYNSPEKYSNLKKKAGHRGYYDVGELKDSRLFVDDSLKSLRHYLSKNLDGIYFGTPELEKQLRKQGISCKVDKKLSVIEIMTGFAFGLWCSSSFRRKIGLLVHPISDL